MSDKPGTNSGFLRRLLRRFADTAEDVDETIDEALKDEEERHPPTVLEWTGRLLSVLLVVLLVGYVVWEGIQPDRAPEFAFEVRSSEIEQRAGSWVAPVEVRNDGTESVIDLSVTVQLVDGSGEVVEEEESEFPLLGAGERQEVVFWFDEDPRDYEIRFDVGNYKSQ